jgi:hypothetical protein
MNYCVICKIKKWFEDMFGVNICNKDCPYKAEKSNNNGKD